MFREMRRSRQQLSKEECEQILCRGTNGVLAVQDADGYPYAVPMSYVYTDGVVYFHCAKAGHKLDAIAHCDKVSFCVVDKDEIVPEKFTTLYRSVIVFGRASVVEDEEEKLHSIRVLMQKYSPNEGAAKAEAEIDAYWGRLCMVKLDIAHMTGKQAIELVEK